VPCTLWHCLPEMWTRQTPDVWQTATVMTEANYSNSFNRPWRPDRQLYQTSVAQFRQAIAAIYWMFLCEKLVSVLLQCLYPLLQQMRAVSYSVIFWCYSIANVNSFLSPNQIKITSFSNCFKQLSLAQQLASASSSSDVSLNTPNQDFGEKYDPYDSRLCYLTRWTMNLWLGLFSQYQLIYTAVTHPSVNARLVCRCCAFSQCKFLKANISQDSVATHLTCGGTCNNPFVANFPLSVAVEKIVKSINIWQRYGQEFGVFLTHSV